MGLCDRIARRHRKVHTLIYPFDKDFLGVFGVVWRLEELVVVRHIYCRYAGLVLVEVSYEGKRSISRIPGVQVIEGR